MTWDHDRVEELLAGQALGSLDPEEAALSERALVEHVPECDRCRQALEDYRALAGDLALTAPPARPPDALLLRLRRETGPRRRPFVGARWLETVAAAAAILGLIAWNLLLVGRLNRAEGRLDRAQGRQALMVEAMAAVGSPDASVVPMTGSPGVRAAMIYVHERHEAYFLASGLPQGDYQLWLVTAESWESLGTFISSDGIAVLRATAEAQDLREVVVTEAAPLRGPFAPSDLPRVVGATLPPGGEGG